jgi:hypothetical protein
MTESKFSEKLYDTVHTKLKEISLLRFSQFSGIENISSDDMDRSTDLTFDHWVCLILVGVPGLKIGFRCHFSSKIARLLTKVVLGDSSSLHPETCHSFIGEYSNLVGGSLKNCLNDELSKIFKGSLPATLTLPQKDPSYDSLDKDQDKENEVKRHMWKLKWDEGEVICASILDIDQNILNKSFPDLEELLKRIQSVTVDDEGDVDYF